MAESLDRLMVGVKVGVKVGVRAASMVVELVVSMVASMGYRKVVARVLWMADMSAMWKACKMVVLKAMS